MSDLISRKRGINENMDIKHEKLLYQYINRIVETNKIAVLYIIEGDSYIDFLHDNLSYNEWHLIRNMIFERSVDLPMAIKALEQVPCEDVISRQAAIEALQGRK